MNKGKTNEQRVLDYLPTDKAKAVSTVQISVALFIADPRRAIAHLRRKKYNILDYWKKSERGKRYKVYYLGE